MKFHTHVLYLAVIGFVGVTSFANASYVLVNGGFEDTSGTFPTGWSKGGSGTVSAGAGFVSGSSADALMTAGAVMSQDFSGATVASAENYDFQLDFAFRTSGISTTTDQRFRLRDNNNTGDLITLGFESAATGGGTALSYFSGTWQRGIDVAFAASTTYYFRVNGYDLDLASRYYTLSYSTDGVNYVTSANITGFHFAPVGSDFETVAFDAGTQTTRIDSVTVVPEPAAALLGTLGLFGLLRRRR
ncbi:MAG: hypothetical protein H7A49_12625 [Akkermansiaceae bacterium]|nr:hypothetical protein [Akkermansiaceae bacterium]MCP5544740.1 hypothetical protein [Akkermansiaceae bacterium]MCP5545880.1 hypothetical protein [Akkermansiaceae bacterium]